MSAEDAACNKITELALNDRKVGCMLFPAAAPILYYVLLLCGHGMPLWRWIDKRAKPETPVWHR